MERSGGCRSCGAGSIERVVDLGAQPACDFFPPQSAEGDEPHWPLEAWTCTSCWLFQLGPAQAPAPEDPLAVESSTMHEHAAHAASRVLAEEGLGPGDTVIELDSHHGGSWLAHLIAAGLQAREPEDRADLVVDVHALAHQPDVDAFLATHARRIAPGGRLILEFHHLLPLVREGHFDTIRHGHWSYLSVLALRPALLRHGLVVTAVREVPLFGGSLQVTARRADDSPLVQPSVGDVVAAERAAGLDRLETLCALDARATRSAEALRDYLQRAAAVGRRVAGYGAPSKASVLLCKSGVDAQLLPFTVDIAPDKQGRRVPGARIPIRAPQELRRARPDEVLILTWDIADEVIRQLEASGGWGASYVVPLPEPHMLAAGAA